MFPIPSPFVGEHVTYTQASPVKATSVAHCLGNRTPHVTHPRFPPPPNRRPRPPWRSCECRTRSARLHKLAGAASAQPLRTVVAAAAAAAVAVAAAAAVTLRRLCLACPFRTHHLACTPAAVAAASITDRPTFRVVPIISTKMLNHLMVLWRKRPCSFSLHQRRSCLRM